MQRHEPEAQDSDTTSAKNRPPTETARRGRSNRVGDAKETGRVEAFSDGVFSIAITLLVFMLAIPAVKDLKAGESLAQYLGAHTTQFITFVLSFLAILVMWINHHNTFAFVFRVDRRFMFINGLLLLVVAFLWWPSSTSQLRLPRILSARRLGLRAMLGLPQRS